MSSDNTNIQRIGLGDGCHWCTEAVFQSLQGVVKVAQGYSASFAPLDTFSEAVVVHFDPEIISLAILLEIHLRTHGRTKDHSMRDKYRSAIYTYEQKQEETSKELLEVLQLQFSDSLITQVIPFKQFKASRDNITNYYYSNPNKAFCKQYIDPKLSVLLKEYRAYLNDDKLSQISKQAGAL